MKSNEFIFKKVMIVSKLCFNHVVANLFSFNIDDFGGSTAQPIIFSYTRTGAGGRCAERR